MEAAQREAQHGLLRKDVLRLDRKEGKLPEGGGKPEAEGAHMKLLYEEEIQQQIDKDAHDARDQAALRLPLEREEGGEVPREISRHNADRLPDQVLVEAGARLGVLCEELC